MTIGVKGSSEYAKVMQSISRTLQAVLLAMPVSHAKQLQ